MNTKFNIPDVILYNGSIFTADAQDSVCEALAVCGNEILATGTSAEILALAAPWTKKIDLNAAQKKLAEIMIPVVSQTEQQRLGKIWCLSRKRKALLREYIIQNDRLVAVMASTITTGGGNEK